MLDAILINGQTWLICGGRDFDDEGMFNDAMGDLTRLKGMPARIVHGAASGADRLANLWAARKAINCAAVPADWKTHGPKAGPLRNQRMLDDHKPDFVIAFPGGRGTADMVSRARKAGIDIAEIKNT